MISTVVKIDVVDDGHFVTVVFKNGSQFKIPSSYLHTACDTQGTAITASPRVLNATGWEEDDFPLPEEL